MNDSQKKALQHHHPDLVRDLELNADLTAKFIHHGIFNEDMIEEIKSVKPRKEQIQKLLLLLPRRGPRAFDMFVHSIHDTYHWLAEDLRKTQHKMSLKPECDTITLKEKVDIYVHEKFGQSKRFCEEDKKAIRKFLYKHLKNNHHEEEDHYDSNSRRTSMQSDVSENLNHLQELADSNRNEQKLLSQIYRILNGNSDSDEASESESTEITVDMIQEKAYELNKKVEELQNEIKNCFGIFGLEECKYSLHEILDAYKEQNQHQKAELDRFKERVEKLKKQRRKLEDDMKEKERQLQMSINNLANEQNEHEKSKALIDNLKSECERLQEIHSHHLEKQQTLLTLKSMVKELKPIHRESHEHFHSQDGFDEVDGPPLRLPRISRHHLNRSTHQSRRSMIRDSSHVTHHELPHPKHHNNSSPWKY